MTHTNPIFAKWQQLGGSAPGRWLFGRVLGFMAPYSATIRPRIERLEPGHAVISMADRRRVRNHLKSVHAAAMMNLAELTGGLLATVSMPPKARMIVTGLSIEFVKKARGLLTSEGLCPVPERPDHGQLEVTVTIRDQAGDVVARATLSALVGPVPGA